MPSNRAIYPQTLTNTPVTFVNADSTTAKTIYTAGVNGSKLEAIYATNTATVADSDINIWIKQSSTSYLLGTILLPKTSGNVDNVPTINLLSNSQLPLPKDSMGNPYIYLSSSSSVTLAPTVAMASGKTATFIAQGEDF